MVFLTVGYYLILFLSYVFGPAHGIRTNTHAVTSNVSIFLISLERSTASGIYLATSMLLTQQQQTNN